MDVFDLGDQSDDSCESMEQEISQEPVVKFTHCRSGKGAKRLNKNPLLSQFMMFEAEPEEIDACTYEVFIYNKLGCAESLGQIEDADVGFGKMKAMVGVNPVFE